MKKADSGPDLTKIYATRCALQKQEINVIIPLFLVFLAANSLLYPYRPKKVSEMNLNIEIDQRVYAKCMKFHIIMLSVKCAKFGM